MTDGLFQWIEQPEKRSAATNSTKRDKPIHRAWAGGKMILTGGGP